MPGLTVDSVTKQGTIIYRDKDVVIRDSGNYLEVAEGATQAGLEIVMTLAIQRFGSRIALLGDESFKARVLRTASALKLPVSFVDGAGQHLSAPDPHDVSTSLKPQPGITSPLASDAGSDAARRYIEERESKRAMIADIPRHRVSLPGQKISGRFAGWRRVEGEMLALLKIGDSEIIVVPVDIATQARVKHLAVGEAVLLDEQGMIHNEHGKSRKKGLYI